MNQEQRRYKQSEILEFAKDDFRNKYTIEEILKMISREDFLLIKDIAKIEKELGFRSNLGIIILDNRLKSERDYLAILVKIQETYKLDFSNSTIRHEFENRLKRLGILIDRRIVFEKNIEVKPLRWSRFVIPNHNLSLANQDL